MLVPLSHTIQKCGRHFYQLGSTVFICAICPLYFCYFLSKMRGEDWARVSCHFGSFTSNFGDCHSRSWEKSESRELHRSKPNNNFLRKGLLLSAMLHVPEKGHLVIKRVDLYFHLGWRLKCFWFQSCLASSLPYFTLLAASHRPKRNIYWAASTCQAL